MAEIWEDIKGFEGFYQFSNMFRVKMLSRSVKAGNGYRTIPERVLKLSKFPNGYLFFRLFVNYESTHVSQHRLIGLHFISNPENKPFINHKNGVKDDNRVENLEWATASENSQHAYKTGLRNGLPKEKVHFFGKKGVDSYAFHRTGGLNPKAKKIKCLTLDVTFGCTKEMSDYLGISGSKISEVCNNKRIHASGMSFMFV